MKLINPEDKERKENPGYSKKVLLDENDLGNPWSFVQQIKIKAWEIAKSHHHKIQTEIFILMNENGYWIVNDKEIHPKAWEVLVIEPNDSHTVIASKTNDYIYRALKIKYDQDDLYRD